MEESNGEDSRDSLGITRSNSSIGNTIGDKNSRFPCIEQPTRMTLHCNGYYLWCKRNGSLIVRKKRNDKDEFRLIYDSGEEGTGVVSIQHHKFGGTLSVCKNKENGEYTAACIKKSQEDEKDTEKKEEEEEVNDDDNNNDDEDDDDELLGVPPVSPDQVSEEDQRWCFIKGSDGSGNAVMLKSLSTGHNLGISDDGRLIFCSDEVAPQTILWTIECVTGELAFLSNQALNGRVRCDMAGLLTLSDNWKGWEVFRFMEASHGFVKISSWMHSQWLLCSTKDGEVETCSHAESFKDHRPDNEEDGNKVDDADQNFKCSKWAIEKSPTGNGVVIRSKTHGRFLCVRDNGELRTYHPSDEDRPKETVVEDQPETKPSVVETQQSSPKTSWNDFKNSFRISLDEAKRSMETSMKEAKKSLQKPLDGPRIAESETLVWQIEAAHSQSYYFLSLNLSSEENKAKSIGPFPQVTPNLRKTTKIQFIREDDNITRLCIENTEEKKEIKKQYVACATDGSISLVDSMESENTAWIMDKSQYQEGGTFFKSKAHDLYLSYRKVEDDQSQNDTEKSDNPFNNMFGNSKKEIQEELFGSPTLGMEETWKLDPCMPRAVSSDKIKTFALGTSIAVGTTVAMPFALAGVGALMGAIGAEVGTFTAVVFAGLTGAEAIASVGAIGATAYIVFRPAENSLTDDHRNDEEAEEERAWSKRPLSNWRNW